MGSYLDEIVKVKNFQVAPNYPKGKPGSNDKSFREFRLQLKNKNRDTSAQLVPYLKRKLQENRDISDLVFNDISPNSSKFSSYSFMFSDLKFDVIIARGANKGEKFETKTVNNLSEYFRTKKDKDLGKVVQMMNESNTDFAGREIVSVKQRTGSTKKENVPIADLGAIIGDIVLTDNKGKEWYISLKDVNGNTFSSYSGAASLFDKSGTLQPNSEGAKFLNAFGVDLNLVQAGFDERAGINVPRPKIPVKRLNPTAVEKIMNRGWGMNYFYVRRMAGNNWKVFWMDKEKLDKLSRRIRVTGIRYPSKKSKQITILCSNNYEDYVIELRNSKAGEYPNDTKMKVKK